MFSYGKSDNLKPNPSYYDDIGIVVSPFNLDFPNHIKWIESHPAVGWFYGLPFRKDTGLSHYQSDKVRTCLKVLEDKKLSKKNNKISMIASSKGVTDGHKWRFQLAYALKEYFGELIDIYGFGHKPIEMKDEQ